MTSTRMTKSISELLNKEWPPLGPNVSSFHRRLRDAVMKPLDSFNTAEPRVLISQDIGLEFVIPLALPIVEQDPLMEVEHFQGDLLAAMLRASADFYQSHPDICRRMEKVVDMVPHALDKLDHIDFDMTSEALQDALVSFRAHRA